MLMSFLSQVKGTEISQVRGNHTKLGEGTIISQVTGQEGQVRSGQVAKQSHFLSSGNSWKLRMLFYPHPFQHFQQCLKLDCLAMANIYTCHLQKLSNQEGFQNYLFFAQLNGPAYYKSKQFMILLLTANDALSQNV